MSKLELEKITVEQLDDLNGRQLRSLLRQLKATRGKKVAKRRHLDSKLSKLRETLYAKLREIESELISLSSTERAIRYRLGKAKAERCPMYRKGQRRTGYYDYAKAACLANERSYHRSGRSDRAGQYIRCSKCTLTSKEARIKGVMVRVDQKGGE